MILGGSSGLGLATAKKLAQQGYDLLIVHRDRRIDGARIEKDFDEMRTLGVAVHSYNIDATNAAKRAALLAELPRILATDTNINVLVHSLAKGSLKPMNNDKVQELGQADFQITIDAMAVSLFEWTKALVAADLFATDTRIIAFTSEGNTKTWKNYAAVSAAKAALEAISRNIALEFAPLGIKCNCLQAGITDTASFRRIPGHELLKQNALKRNPNGRLTMPEDVANAAYLLTLPEAKWITGTVLKVDGGESLQ